MNREKDEKINAIKRKTSENDLPEVVHKLWRNISTKLSKKGVKEADIDEAIAGVRESRNFKKSLKYK